MAVPAWLTAQPIAHRGLHARAEGVIENTVGAAKAAMARGFAIECDVQLTRDLEAVVFREDGGDEPRQILGGVWRHAPGGLDVEDEHADAFDGSGHRGRGGRGGRGLARLGQGDKEGEQKHHRTLAHPPAFLPHRMAGVPVLAAGPTRTQPACRLWR